MLIIHPPSVKHGQPPVAFVEVSDADVLFHPILQPVAELLLAHHILTFGLTKHDSHGYRGSLRASTPGVIHSNGGFASHSA